MASTNVTIIPAQPGFQIVEPYTQEDGSLGLAFRPVLAWAVTYGIEGEEVERPIARPVSVDDLGDDWAVRHPDGTTVVPFDRCFEADSDQEVIAFFEKEQRFRAEMRIKHRENVEKLADAIQRGLSREAAARETGLPMIAVANLYDEALRLSRARAQHAAA